MAGAAISGGGGSGSGAHCRQAGAMAEAEAEAVTLSATIRLCFTYTLEWGTIRGRGGNNYGCRGRSGGTNLGGGPLTA